MSNYPAPRLRPIIAYYGSKWRIAKYYPAPKYSTIIEPFAGGAGYSLLWHDRNIILIEKNPKVAAIWRFLINATAQDILELPEFTDPKQSVTDITRGYPEVVKWLIGWWVNKGLTSPRQHIIKSLLPSWKSNDAGVWTRKRKEYLAQIVQYIKHWQIIEGDYTEAPDIEATWFIDPPYQNICGSYYPYKLGDDMYKSLSIWCKERKGQVIVCESQNANWLDFIPLVKYTGSHGQRLKRVTVEAVWYKET